MIPEIPPKVVVQRHRRIFAFLLVIPTVIILAAAVVGALTLARILTPPFNPLYFPGPHVATATVHVGQDVTVTATRCNRSKHPVVYHAVKSWESVDPAGSVIAVGETSATEQPGCTNFHFRNPMPPLVISRTQGLLSTGLQSVTWRIVAIDTPEGHDHAKTVSWQTTPIVVTAAP